MRGALAAFLLLAVAGGLAACGGDSADEGESREARIEELTAGFEKAIATRDAEAFCDLLAPNDVEKLGNGEGDGREQCLIVWGGEQNPLFAASDTELEIESISFEGNYATATLASGGELSFAREGGRWYVHLAPEREG